MSIRTLTTTTAITPSNSRSPLLHQHPRLKQRFDTCHFLGNRSFRSVNTMSLQRAEIGRAILMVVNSVDPGTPPPPSDHSGGSWIMWLVGILFSVSIPFTKNKWLPLLKLKAEVEDALNSAEEVAELVEKVSDEVERVADDIGNHLPEGSKIRRAAEMVEDIADRTGKAAALADDLIEKVEEIERDVESLAEKTDEIREDKIKEDDKIREANIKQEATSVQSEQVSKSEK